MKDHEFRVRLLELAGRCADALERIACELEETSTCQVELIDDDGRIIGAEWVGRGNERD